MLIDGTYALINGCEIKTNRNKDLERSRPIFSRIHDAGLELCDSWPTMIGQPLSKQIYHRPSHFGLLNVHDQYHGSCFKDWFIPSASWRFDISGDRVHVTSSQPNIDVNQYLDKVWQDIRRNISWIYHHHGEAVLHYSGGIDSLLLLAIIKKMGFLANTHIVYFRNRLQDQGQSFDDPWQMQAISDTFAQLKSQAKSLHMIDVTMQDLLDIVVMKDYWSSVCYCTTTVMKKVPCAAHIIGHLGNPVLLHYNSTLDQWLAHGGGPDQLKNCQQQTGYYCEYLRAYRAPEVPVPMKDRHLGNKLFSPLSDLGMGHVYHPIGTPANLELLRELDFSGVEIARIFDADYARELIHRAVGGDFDRWITKGGQNEMNNLSDIGLPYRDQVHHGDIPDLQHDPEGLQWLYHELDRAQCTGQIPLNTLISIFFQKKIQKLAELVQ